MPIEDISNVNETGLCFIIVMGILTIILSRRLALIPIIICTCYMTLGQVLLVGPFHFTFMRILIFFGWMRMVLRREHVSIRLNTIDKVIICWMVASIAIYILTEQNSEAIINQLGFAYNVVGLYFLFRVYIRNLDDICRTLRVIAVIAAPLAILFLIESITGRNVFSIFGGVPEITVIRDGRLRCQGPFRHPVLAGTFGATLIPLCAGLWWQKGRGKLLSFVGVISATVITLTSASSGPVMSYFFGVGALMMWPLRRKMAAVRIVVLSALIALHLIMKAPVWALIGRAGEIIGGGGWHRVALIDAAISHFDEWWLVGTRYTAHWIPAQLAIAPNSVDITNEFISEAVGGGVLRLALFVTIIVLCFREIGRGLRVMEDQPFSIRIMLWSMGAALFAHITAFISVSYFDQIQVFWYLLLAMIAVVAMLSKDFRAKAGV